MKKIIALALVLVMMLSLVACAGSKKITLRMIDTLASESRTAAIQEVIAAYEKDHPNITIELINPPMEGADQKVQQMLQSNEQLDIIDTGNGFQTCLNNGWIQPLDDYLKDWSEWSTVSEAAKSRMNNFGDEHYWMIPYGLYQMILFYRKDILADNGIEVPETWTWENLYDIALKCTNPEKGTYGYAFRGGTRGYNHFTYMNLANHADDQILDNENYRYFAADGTALFGDEKSLQNLEFYKDLFTNCCPPDSITWGFTEMVQGFESGQCAILLQDNDCIPMMENDLDASLWGVGNIPIGDSGYGTQSCGYGGWALTAKTKYAKEAADFILYLSSAENNGNFCAKTGLLPIHTTTYEQNSYFSSGSYTAFTDMNKLNYRILANGALGFIDASALFGENPDDLMQQYLMGQIEAKDLLDYWAGIFNDAVAKEGKVWEK